MMSDESKAQFQREHTAWTKRHRPLRAVLSPKSIAVIADFDQPGNEGTIVLQNLLNSSFGGKVYPVTQDQEAVHGLKSFASIEDVPVPVDLAVVSTSAAVAPDIVRRCEATGVKGALVTASGFRDSAAGEDNPERELREIIARGNIRVIGPNSLGFMRPYYGLNVSAMKTMARPGNVGFVSQSGALCASVLDWSFRENVGFSAFLSIGAMLDVNWGDLIPFLADDSRTKSIVIYMEAIGDAHAFLSAAREVALTKPIVVLKAGRTRETAQAVLSRTGALTGADAVLDAAFRRVGVLRVDHIAELFYMAEILAKQPRSHGRKLTILTNASGPAVVATDALIRHGGSLAEFSEQTTRQLEAIFPPGMPKTRTNPIDVQRDADAERYASAFRIATEDANSDGVLVILTPQPAAQPARTAEQMKRLAQNCSKPVLASWMGGAEVAAGEAILNQANIPTFAFPDTAVRVFNYMWRYNYNLHGLYETPSLVGEHLVDATRRQTAEKIIREARTAKRALLSEFETKRILQAYGIPTASSQIAQSADAAVALAEQIGYPVVLKLHSQAITHEADVGGVRLDVFDAQCVRRGFRQIKQAVSQRVGAEYFQGVRVQPMLQRSGFEVILGSSIDAQFGPVLLFGLGGLWTDVYRDRAHSLPPLNTTLARRMMEQTQIFQAMRKAADKGRIDLEGLERLMVNFSQLVVEQPRIREIDINPLLVRNTENLDHSQPALVALDARIVLHPSSVADAVLPQSVIRPYPQQYASEWRLRDGRPVLIRPIRPEDETLMVNFHQTLSDQSVYFRYFHPLNLSERITHERLARICFIDYEREMALVVQYENPRTHAMEIIGVGRLSKLRTGNMGEYAIIISDAYQKQGIGTELLKRLLEIGRQEGLEKIIATILPENRGMQGVSKKLGFQLQVDMDEHIIKASIDL